MDPPLRLIALVHHHMTVEGRRGTKSKEENEQNTWEKKKMMIMKCMRNWGNLGCSDDVKNVFKTNVVFFSLAFFGNSNSGSSS